ncbi:MAG: TetM/TetW/TetO/TetS family tetracycline resistance ribosomal protection protein [Eubacterium sp.]|nr:TetM/TetW/TetO/TetS family tetracycline resistance ribosomal protection protein [Eubacterium sp.]
MKTKYLTIGIFAHVDAGKTTLAEGLFYLAKKTRRLGRVDHKDAFLDYYGLERDRGITVFSKTASLPLGKYTAFLLDTPGHVDFSAEMERTLSVLDYAILIIGGTDGVQSHTRTLSELFSRYQVPLFVFVNKMDRPETDRAVLMEQLKAELGDGCVDFGPYVSGFLRADGESITEEEFAAFSEEVAMLDEGWMEDYLAGKALTEEVLRKLIAGRSLFPCFFGSALKMDGVQAFYDAMSRLIEAPSYPDSFGAQVYKVARDEKGGLEAHAKITGGSLFARQTVVNGAGAESKVNQIRIYDGKRFETASEANAGMIVALTGLEDVRAGDMLQTAGGTDQDAAPSGGIKPVLKPVLQYTIAPVDDADPKILFQKIKDLAQEDPQLALSWNERTQEINARLMGEVQIGILQQMIKERFDADVVFRQGAIVYQETVSKPVIGIGHFDPLKHYAEVHVLIEPAKRGSGITYENRCPDDVLERTWQKTAMRHLMEKEHVGVLTGSALTDVKISLISGRAHKKHSEGSDFREAAYRAVRQGLMMAENVLLSPVYAFELKVPVGQIGRAMTDIRNMDGTFDDPQMDTDWAVLKGTAPVAAMQDYSTQVASYTAGTGSLSCRFGGYEPCKNTNKIVAEIGYDPDADLDNPSSSLFCRQGAAVFVPWNEVPEAARAESGIEIREADDMLAQTGQGSALTGISDRAGKTDRPSSGGISAFSAEDKELQAIFERTYGSKTDSETQKNRSKKSRTDMNGNAPGSLMQSHSKYQKKEKPPGEVFLLVDGYNIIHAWEELKVLAKENLDSARDALMDILSEYHGSRQGHLIVVFDAYKVKGGQEHVYRYHNIDVVYTREAETADAYIERVTRKIGKNNDVTVATSDGLEQIIIWGHGARRMSASELKAEVEQAKIEVRMFLAQRNSARNRLLDHLPEEEARLLEQMRLGNAATDEVHPKNKDR